MDQPTGALSEIAQLKLDEELCQGVVSPKGLPIL